MTGEIKTVTIACVDAILGLRGLKIDYDNKLSISYARLLRKNMINVIIL
jgi:hypothetical protein